MADWFQTLHRSPLFITYVHLILEAKKKRTKQKTQKIPCRKNIEGI